MRGHTEGFFLGPYKVLELIAKGRMAGVYKAEHTSGQVVAIKVLPASKAKDPETLARFKREGRLLTRLDHPNVVRAFHLGESAGKNYLVLEYLDGDTLEEVLERSKRVPPLEAVRIIHQAMLGLQHIHERGMIHRDLKPANLMLVNPSGPGTADRTVKILDIGLGKAVFSEGEKSPVDDPSQLTTDGVLIGTPDYLAPEQARSAKTADIRSDIYSLGCVLYHALTGQPPFPDKSVLNQVMRHATEQPRPLTDFLSEVPDGLQNVMNWMMAKDPAQRVCDAGTGSSSVESVSSQYPAKPCSDTRDAGLFEMAGIEPRGRYRQATSGASEHSSGETRNTRPKVGRSEAARSPQAVSRTRAGGVLGSARARRDNAGASNRPREFRCRIGPGAIAGNASASQPR